MQTAGSMRGDISIWHQTLKSHPSMSPPTRKEAMAIFRPHLVMEAGKKARSSTPSPKRYRRRPTSAFVLWSSSPANAAGAPNGCATLRMVSDPECGGETLAMPRKACPAFLFQAFVKLRHTSESIAIENQAQGRPCLTDQNRSRRPRRIRYHLRRPDLDGRGSSGELMEAVSPGSSLFSLPRYSGKRIFACPPADG